MQATGYILLWLVFCKNVCIVCGLRIHFCNVVDKLFESSHPRHGSVMDFP